MINCEGQLEAVIRRPVLLLNQPRIVDEQIDPIMAYSSKMASAFYGRFARRRGPS